MASSQVNHHHHRLIYVLIVGLYVALAVNVFYSYQVNVRCSAACHEDHLSSLISEYCAQQATITTNSHSPPKSLLRAKRQFVHHEIRHQHHKHRNQVNSSEDDLTGLSDDHHYEQQRRHTTASEPTVIRRHRTRSSGSIGSQSSSINNVGSSQSDDASPAVEFFPKPQPTQETSGYVWLTSYSRIPVGASYINTDTQRFHFYYCLHDFQFKPT